jgi:uncharacterized membrane protein
MALVVGMVALLHAAGAGVAKQFEDLSVAFHTVGTIALGGAIALAGQIYNLAEHWPAAVMLWGFGAAIAWALLRQWTQAALVAILFPAWLASEWSVRMLERQLSFAAPVASGICALSLVYLSARRETNDSLLRKAFMWLGGIALLPSAIFAAGLSNRTKVDLSVQIIGWSIALLAPIAVAWLLRHRDALWAIVAVGWAGMLGMLNNGPGDRIAIYAWCAVGAVGLAFWGIREARPERVNLGIAGFALTVLCFYFSNVMDKLGRSASLIGMGILFLGGGWMLERMRRNLLARIREEAI